MRAVVFELLKIIVVRIDLSESQVSKSTSRVDISDSREAQSIRNTSEDQVGLKLVESRATRWKILQSRWCLIDYEKKKNEMFVNVNYCFIIYIVL